MEADDTSLLKTMFSGLIAAIILCLPIFAIMTERDWPWAYAFPLSIFGNGFECFIIFFHEIGHSVAGWFYGMPTVPMFDFAHGGGWAFAPVGQVVPLLFVLWAAAGYGFFVTFSDVWPVKIMLVVLVLFNMATAFNSIHETLFDFMGPAFEPLTGGFFLYRALFNLTPRGGERFLSALFGFAMPFHTLIEGWGLTHNPDARERYWMQKDGQGAGDFDKIADRMLHGTFDGIVMIWMGLTVLCLIAPFALYAWNRARYADPRD